LLFVSPLRPVVSSAEALLKSHEMATFVRSTGDVVKVAGGIAVKAVFWPVLLPFHVACATKDFVGWTVHQAVAQTSGALMQKQQQLTAGDLSKSNSSAEKSNDNEENGPQKGHPLGGILQFVPVVLDTAGRIKDEIGATVFAIVAPPTPATKGVNASKAVQQDKEMLERLKIPVFSGTDAPETPTATTPTPQPLGVTRADFTKYLMRVEDLNVYTPGTTKAHVLFIDLSAEYGDKLLRTECFDKLAERALSLSTPPTSGAPDSPDVAWGTEGNTAKLLRKRSNQTPERWEETLRSDILLWSGNFRNRRAGGSTHASFPLYLARGVVEGLGPRDMLEMMWDNRKTCQYNHFCAGREDVLQIDDRLLLSKNVHTGTKVVRSETRVPLTSLTVHLVTVMHCRALPGGPQEGYMIVSRSLVSGMAGYHTKATSGKIEKTKTEILWGVNIFRCVPGHPRQTDLTSLSQMSSSMVPQFVSHRIGIMGIEDFFRNVRNPKIEVEPESSPVSPTSDRLVSPV